jgi:2'-5' RNA ligase
VSRRWTEETERLFVALDLPREVARAVTDWQQRELGDREDLRLAGSLHLTLCFLGDTPRDRVTAIQEAIGTVAWSPVVTRFAEPLFLPERGQKRVVALRLDDPMDVLAALQADVAAALAGRGLFKPEKRPFLPHLTVARYRRPGHPFSLQNVTIPEFGVVRMVLYSSLLERAGAVHTPVTVFPAS